MDNITIITRGDGSREIIHSDSLYSDHLALYKAVLAKKPKGVSSVEVWRSQRGRVKSKSFKAGKNSPELAEVLEGIELQHRDNAQGAAYKDEVKAAAKEAKAAQAKAEEEAVAQAQVEAKAAKEAAAKANAEAEQKGGK